MKSIIPYEPDSYYKKTDNIYYNLMGKSFFVEGDELIVLQNLADAILVYDLKDNFQLKKTIPIAHSNFEQYSPLPIGTPMDDSRMKELTFMAGRNEKIISLDDQVWLLSYYQGLSPALFESRNSEENPFSISKARDKLRLLVFENGKQVDGELNPPNGRLFFGLKGNRILVQDEPSEKVEEEFTRYSIYELRKE
jgi:hypothetical protein